jgi:hypothetical protein
MVKLNTEQLAQDLEKMLENLQKKLENLQTKCSCGTQVDKTSSPTAAAKKPVPK